MHPGQGALVWISPHADAADFLHGACLPFDPACGTPPPVRPRRSIHFSRGRWSSAPADRCQPGPLRTSPGPTLLQEVTKTAAGYRTIILPQAAIAALLLQQAQQAKDRLASGNQWQDDGWVFTTGTGGLLLPSNVYRDYARIRDRAGVPRLPFHALRHSAVSVQLAAGVPLEIISRKIGHKNGGLTADTYGHLLEESDRGAAAQVDATLSWLVGRGGGCPRRKNADTRCLHGCLQAPNPR